MHFLCLWGQSHPIVFDTIQVVVTQVGGRNLIARARRGYYARNEQGEAPAEARKKASGNKR